MAEEGLFTLTTRVYLSAGQRTRLQQLVTEQGIDLPELLSELLGSYLDALPVSPLPPATSGNKDTELAHHRAELQRVRAQMRAAGPQAPSWLAGYVAELEAAIRTMTIE